HDVRGCARAGRELARSEDRDLRRPSAALGKLDLLVDAVLGNGEVDVLEVERELHRFPELALGSRLQGLFDGREDGCFLYHSITWGPVVSRSERARRPVRVYYGC